MPSHSYIAAEGPVADRASFLLTNRKKGKHRTETPTKQRPFKGNSNRSYLKGKYQNLNANENMMLDSSRGLV